jgi:hypothetical protein
MSLHAFPFGARSCDEKLSAFRRTEEARQTTGGVPEQDAKGFCTVKPRCEVLNMAEFCFVCVEMNVCSSGEGKRQWVAGTSLQG